MNQPAPFELLVRDLTLGQRVWRGWALSSRSNREARVEAGKLSNRAYLRAGQAACDARQSARECHCREHACEWPDDPPSWFARTGPVSSSSKVCSGWRRQKHSATQRYLDSLSTPGSTRRPNLE